MTLKLKFYVFFVITETFVVTVAAQTNLVHKGHVEQMTTLIDSYGVHSAHLAIEGPANNNWEDGCSSTQTGQARAWWALILPEVAYITNIVIYFRGDKPDQMNEFRLYLGNGTLHGTNEILCYTDLKIPGYPETTQDIDCYILAKNVYFFNRHKVVQLCYIEINGCFKGTWGANCSELCPPKCINQHCYPKNGSCVWGCDPYNCINNKCDIKTGVCIGGCANERAGQYCNVYNLASNGTARQNPPNPNYPANLSIDGNRANDMCSLTSGKGSYLQIDTGLLSVISTVFLTYDDTQLITNGEIVVYCSNTSDSWVDGIVLYQGERPTRDINVLTVCRYIIYVPPVESGLSTVDVCEIEIGGCPFGRYGLNCKHACHCNGPYDLKTGNCTFGCLDGWIGYRCDISCGSGNFGSECSKHCSANCLYPPCNHVSGECTGGCNAGWEGCNCTEECDIGYFGSSCSKTCFGCISHMCEKVDGICKNSNACSPGYLNGQYCNQECDNWYFGINCENKCNCRSKPCNKFDGTCSVDGCEKGWHGDSCDKDCTHGYFGFSCKEFCEKCFNNSCDILEGNCRAGCIDGYHGKQCTMSVLADSTSTDSPVSTQIGLFIGALLLGALLTVGIISILIKRRICITCIGKGQRNIASNHESHEHQNDNLGMETTSTYDDLTAHSTSNEYDQINTLYVNQI